MHYLQVCLLSIRFRITVLQDFENVLYNRNRSYLGQQMSVTGIYSDETKQM